MNPITLVSLLSDGNFHSGSELGRALGVSRTAVWKSLSLLSGFGLEVESVKGRGYRLSRPIELLDQDRIMAGIDPDKKDGLSLHLAPEVDSTNTAVSNIERSGERYTVLLAEKQTAGRGRRGRQWVSPFGQNLYISVRFDLQGGPEALAGLSLVAGLAVADALQFLSIPELALKWPNDVLAEGRKLAGILVELQGEATTGWTVVVGVGLNHSMEADQSELIDQPWTSLAEYSDCGRNKCAAALITSLVLKFDEFQLAGFGPFRERWMAFDFFSGKSVQLLDGSLSGQAGGVDAAGNLLIETVAGTKTVNAGEVSVRAG